MSASQSPPRKRVRNNNENREALNESSSQQGDRADSPNPSSSGKLNSSGRAAMGDEISNVAVDAGDQVASSSTGSSSSSGSIRKRETRKLREKNKSKNGATARSSRSSIATKHADNGADVDSDDNTSLDAPSDTGSDEGNFECFDSCDLSPAVLSKIPRLAAGLAQVDKEVIRLIGQYLTSVGLNNSAAVLMTETGCRLDQPTASTFRKLVMNGDWSNAVKTLEELKRHLAEPGQVVEMKFLLLEQKYLELLYNGNSIEALKVLQTEITPLKHNQTRTHELSSYLMFSSKEDLVRATSHGHHSKVDDITDTATRRSLMERLQEFLPASVMLPPKRLQTLLNQSAEFQIERCLYHNKPSLSTSTPFTFPDSLEFKIDSSFLAVDHQCSKENFPCETIQILTDHCEEVWYTKFSPDGLKLASGSKDNTVIIWDFDPGSLMLTHNKTFDRHSQGVSYFAWSPDSTRLAVCGPEDCDEVFLWNVETGLLEGKISHSTEDSLITVSWSPDGKKIACGGTRGQFYHCDSKGQVVDSWEGVRVQCLSYRRDGKTVLAADTHHRIRCYNFEELSDYQVIQEDHGIMTFTLDDSDRYALLNVVNQGLHLWDIEERCLVRKFTGTTQGFYTIYSCFGGADQNFIASGSENSNVYIYHVKKEEPIAVLTGHSRVVCCVTWNPVYPQVLVSCSDDGTLRVWGPAEKYRKKQAAAASASTLVQNNGELISSVGNSAANGSDRQNANHCSNGVV